MAESLVAKVRIAAISAAPPAAVAVPKPPIVLPRSRSGQTKIVVIGTSTGGPQALTQLIPALPSDLPVPVALVLHIPVGYTRSLAERLDRASGLTVLEAEHGLDIEPGMVAIAPAGVHLRLERRGEYIA